MLCAPDPGPVLTAAERPIATARGLLQMPQPRSRSWAVRLLGLSYGIFCVIVLSSYTANLAAFLTVPLDLEITTPLLLFEYVGPCLHVPKCSQSCMT